MPTFTHGARLAGLVSGSRLVIDITLGPTDAAEAASKHAALLAALKALISHAVRKVGGVADLEDQ